MVAGRLVRVVQQPTRAAEVAEAIHLAAEVWPRAVVTAITHRLLQVRVDLHLRSARQRLVVARGRHVWTPGGATCTIMKMDSFMLTHTRNVQMPFYGWSNGQG